MDRLTLAGLFQLHCAGFALIISVGVSTGVSWKWIKKKSEITTVTAGLVF